MSELDKESLDKCRKLLDPAGEFKLNVYRGDTLAVEFSHYDVILGNPPYNCGSQTLYHRFIEKFIDKCRYLLFITCTPSRWFSGGKGLGAFRKMMLARTDIRLIKHFDNASEIFKGVNINGGVSYFLRDSSYSGKCKFNGAMTDLSRYDVVVEPKWNSLIEKFKDEPKLSDLYFGRCYGIETNDKRLLDKPVAGAILCYVNQKMGFRKWIKGAQPDGCWKVITARAIGSAPRFGNTFIGKPNEVHCGSYLSFRVNSQAQAESLLSFMKCKLTYMMLATRKSSQNLCKDTIAWVPPPPLNRVWTDGEVAKYYRLRRR
ncbi:MAG: Eco57I restriction-modification methylase domain-containing protein [Candidatus Pacebacteria bacterium]|nr:Eco57I restriction-modification methylase domain-containing protein [Candidatus Paceibacterota bacterium]